MTGSLARNNMAKLSWYIHSLSFRPDVYYYLFSFKEVDIMSYIQLYIS